MTFLTTTWVFNNTNIDSFPIIVKLKFGPTYVVKQYSNKLKCIRMICHLFFILQMHIEIVNFLKPQSTNERL